MFIFNCRPEDNARWRAQQQAKQAAEAAAEAELATALRGPSEPRGTAAEEGRKARRGAARRGHSTPQLERPLSAGTHLKKMLSVSGSYVDTKPCKEHHREYYYSRNRLGLAPPLGELPQGVIHHKPPANELLPPPPKGKRWGPLTSDYGKAGNDVNRMWTLRDIQRHKSEPMVSCMADLGRPAPRLNPSVDSGGVLTCMVGGTTIALRETLRVPSEQRREDVRQLGLYEDSFRHWRGSYGKPENGLSSTDVTAFADMAVMQKNLMRK